MFFKPEYLRMKRLLFIGRIGIKDIVYYLFGYITQKVIDPQNSKRLIKSSMDSMSLSRIIIIIIIIHQYSPIIHFTLRSLLDTDISYTNRIKKMKREMQD